MYRFWATDDPSYPWPCWGGEGWDAGNIGELEGLSVGGSVTRVVVGSGQGVRVGKIVTCNVRRISMREHNCDRRRTVGFQMRQVGRDGR